MQCLKVMSKKTKIIDPDIFLKSMIKNVGNFYDMYYHGQFTGKKNYHIRKLLENYDKKRFSQAENLYEERSKFLGEMQDLVDNKYVGSF